MTNFRIVLIVFLFGTIAISWVGKCQLAEKDDPTLVGYNSTECNSELDIYIAIDRVISKEVIGDTLLLKIGVKKDCGFSFNPGITFENNHLNIQLDTTKDSKHKTTALCDCYFELTLFLQMFDDTAFGVSIGSEEISMQTEPYETFPVQYEFYKGEEIQ